MVSDIFFETLAPLNSFSPGFGNTEVPVCHCSIVYHIFQKVWIFSNMLGTCSSTPTFRNKTNGSLGCDTS